MCKRLRRHVPALLVAPKTSVRSAGVKLELLPSDVAAALATLGDAGTRENASFSRPLSTSMLTSTPGLHAIYMGFFLAHNLYRLRGLLLFDALQRAGPGHLSPVEASL